MKLLEERILKDGVIIDNDILKVDSFLNHQIDTELTRNIAKEIAECFKGFGINKILTIETSGLPVSFAVAEEMGNLPLVFAKKSKSLTVGNDVYKAEIKSFILSNIACFMPEIFIMSRILLYLPFFSLYSTIAFARDCPIPGNLVNSSSFAVLMFIF